MLNGRCSGHCNSCRVLSYRSSEIIASVLADAFLWLHVLPWPVHHKYWYSCIFANALLSIVYCDLCCFTSRSAYQPAFCPVPFVLEVARLCWLVAVSVFKTILRCHQAVGLETWWCASFWVSCGTFFKFHQLIFLLITTLWYRWHSRSVRSTKKIWRFEKESPVLREATLNTYWAPQWVLGTTGVDLTIYGIFQVVGMENQEFTCDHVLPLAKVMGGACLSLSTYSPRQDSVLMPIQVFFHLLRCGSHTHNCQGNHSHNTCLLSVPVHIYSKEYISGCAYTIVQAIQKFVLLFSLHPAWAV